jgi:hypothetical protein
MKPEMIVAHASKGHQAFSVCVRVFIVAGFVIATLFSLMMYSLGDWVITAVQSLKPWLACWRVGVFLSLIGGWPYWINHYAHWAKLDADQQQFLINYRWRFAAVLLGIEAILVQRVFAGLMP